MQQFITMVTKDHRQNHNIDVFKTIFDLDITYILIFWSIHGVCTIISKDKGF